MESSVKQTNKASRQNKSLQRNKLLLTKLLILWQITSNCHLINTFFHFSTHHLPIA